MRDQDTHLQQEPLWWASDVPPGDVAASPSFDEPLEWPDAMAWESLFEGGPPTQPAYVPDDFAVDLVFSPETPAVEDRGRPPTEAHLEPLPASIWAPDPADGEETQTAMAALGGAATAVAAPMPPPIAAAEPRRPVTPPWLRRLHVRHGSAAVVALACCVSLVVLGMFLSVRSRDELPTQTTRFEPSGGQIAAEGATSSIVPPTTVTTTAPPSTISLSDLIPADALADAGASGTTTTAARASTPATTAAPSRSTAPSGGGGGPAQQPTNTTAAPDPEPTSPSTTSPPADETTTTRPPRAMPTIPDYSIPTFTIPNWPSASQGSSLRSNKAEGGAAVTDQRSPSGSVKGGV